MDPASSPASWSCAPEHGVMETRMLREACQARKPPLPYRTTHLPAPGPPPQEGAWGLRQPAGARETQRDFVRSSGNPRGSQTQQPLTGCPPGTGLPVTWTAQNPPLGTLTEPVRTDAISPPGCHGGGVRGSVASQGTWRADTEPGCAPSAVLDPARGTRGSLRPWRCPRHTEAGRRDKPGMRVGPGVSPKSMSTQNATV